MDGPRIASDGSVRVGRVSGVPVLLAPSWWIGALVVVVLYTPLVGRVVPETGLGMSIGLAAAFAALLGLSVFAHELGHTVVALRMGMGVRRLQMFLLGGVSEVIRTPERAGQEGLVAAAGPTVSVVLAVAFGGLAAAFEPYTLTWLLVAQCAVANLAVAVFNLLPGLPLDGGRMLRAGIWALTGRRSTGTTVAVAGGWLVAGALIAWAVAGMVEGGPDRWLRLGICLVTGWFVASGATAERSAEKRRAWPEGVGLADLMRPVVQLPAESPVSDAIEASGGRAVLLVRADGVTAGLLDAAVAARLAQRSPHAPASQAAGPVRPEAVLMLSEDTDDVAERVRTTPAFEFLVVDDEGKPAGVLLREDVR